jgi:hypothetical protein
VVLNLSISYKHFFAVNVIPYPNLKFKESDLVRSNEILDFLLNQKCFLAWSAVNLYYFFFSNRHTKSFAGLL